MERELAAENSAVRIQLRRMDLFAVFDPCCQFLSLAPLVGFEVEDLSANHSISIEPQHASIDHSSYQGPIEQLEQPPFSTHLQPQQLGLVPRGIAVAAQRIANHG